MFGPAWLAGVGALLCSILIAGCAGHSQLAADLPTLPAVPIAAKDRPEVAFTLKHPLSKPAPGFKTEPLHHFQPGDRWNYRVRLPHGEASAILTVLPGMVKAPDGKPCLVIQAQSKDPGGKVSVSRGAFRQDKSGSELIYGISDTASGAFHWGISPRTYSVRLRNPLYPGLQWVSTIYLDDHRTQLFQSAIEKEETVTVPAGTFKALLAHEQTLYARGQNVERIRKDRSWLVPRIGLPVRIETSGRGGSVVQELTSFKFAQG